MSYQLRHQSDAEWHHVTNRGARHQAVFYDEVDREVFLKILAETPDHCAMMVAAWCLMGNHYHLVIHGTPAEMSIGMQRLSSLYTRKFNTRHGYDGPLFRGRFYSKEIRTDAQLLRTVRYVHRNPYDVEGVTQLRRYRWSSHLMYARSLPVPRWMETAAVLDLAGGARNLEDFILAA